MVSASRVSEIFRRYIRPRRSLLFLTMTIFDSLIVLVVWIIPGINADVVLNEKIMELTKIAAQLSNLVYDEHPTVSHNNNTGLHIFHDKPYRALIAQMNGYCFGAFRGDTMTWDDWQQNSNKFESENVCVDPHGGTEMCCLTRLDFYEAYNTVYRDQFEAAIRNCASNCTNRDECLVLTGHSQGGAAAAIAALYLSDLNPYVITFGQPPTVNAPCDRITSQRWYRYINTKTSDTSTIGIVYDPVPFVPSDLCDGADNFGHMILLSDDNSGVAYIGLDAQDYFGPLNASGFEAHRMVAHNKDSPLYPGYLDRIQVIMKRYDNGTYPVRTSGYIAGSSCTQNVECQSKNCQAETAMMSTRRCVGTQCQSDGDCPTARCDSGMCLAKAGSCEPCDENSDCVSEQCSWKFRCTGDKGLMDDNCYCNFDGDCRSGRCEGTLVDRICEARLGLGGSCNEGSDCLSRHCSWRFRCEDRAWARAANDSREGRLFQTEDDDNDDDNEISNEKPSVLLFGFIVTAVGLVVGVWGFRWYQRRRRRGYEEIPVNLNV